MPRLGPRARVEIGASVLAAASVANTEVARDALVKFAAVHEQYVHAQEGVSQRERQLNAARQQLDGRCHALWRRIEHLAVALMMEGQPRMRPFRRFGAPSLSVLQRFAAAKRATAVLRLAAAVRRMHSGSSKIIEAADAAALAAEAVRAGIVALRAPEAALRDARAARDAIGRQWDRRLTALRHAAHAAHYVDSPRLHRLLFESANRHPSVDRRRRRSKE